MPRRCPTSADGPGRRADPASPRRPAARLAAGCLAACCLTAVLSGCDAGAVTAPDPARVDVVAAFYPLRFLTERVGGDAVSVIDLAKPGVEPHDLELTPIQVGQVSEAELVVYLAGFQPAVDEAVGQEGGDRAFDVAAVVPLLSGEAGGHEHEGGAVPADPPAGGMDPHLWLDPTRLATAGDSLAERLGAADPDHAAAFSARAAALRAELERLDREYADGLRTCQRRELVVSHTAFGYLADRYDLEQIAISGLSPEEDPSPRRLADVAREAREHGATTIFFETLVSPKVAETIAREIGAGTAVLDPLEGIPPGSTDDYFSVMRKNLATLRPALGCT